MGAAAGQMGGSGLAVAATSGSALHLLTEAWAYSSGLQPTGQKRGVRSSRMEVMAENFWRTPHPLAAPVHPHRPASADAFWEQRWRCRGFLGTEMEVVTDDRLAAILDETGY
ncbi:MAG: hypothetical protein LQ348_003800 [Seirophora lacunosa]|nr:MAG: hypothetical protein LQ348_003800 [Seirophora lacunosa]